MHLDAPQNMQKRMEKLLNKASYLTYIDRLSLKNAKGKKHIEILKVRDLIIYILIEEYPHVVIKEWKKEFPSVLDMSNAEIRKKVHRRMNGNNDYIDLYLKLKG